MSGPMESALADAHRALRIEGDAIHALSDRLGEPFSAAVEALLECSGRAVVCGIGKSGAISRKLASTLASTGTPAFFLHPAEAVHGDIGTVTSSDVVIMLSYSGETEEILRLLPQIRRAGAKIVALCGRRLSTLARECDWFLDVSVEREACPLGLAPTASAAAMLALGDALAVAVMSARGFSAEEFAESHPAGTIGRKLLLRVRDLMHAGDDNPTVGPDAAVREALLVMTASPLRGVVSIVARDGALLGVFTDGDLRRLLNESGPEALDRAIGDVMTLEPTTIRAGELAADAARVFQENEFDNMPVVDAQGRAIGTIDVQDVLKAGLI